MQGLFTNLLIIDSILIVIATLMQPSKQQDALSALSGGATDLFGKQKSRGFEAFMEKVTVVLGVLFFAFSLVLVYLSSH
ncbi:preprotein translocase subunit SecG [Lacticaseibacillus baoqingensis]|uniref:Protein-export membrane protein SecG n=1 Tax=Lacticaseibacillus baoqingensis TaxID=2486013 RepID=A0ABW4E455_9LACO|nr:preprotein translocase subunit SecG [Lacticaseibacillus baoqingensis]MCI1985208.1 preprotein translocase subunit SecG [Lactobacillus sp.]MCI2032432.1 preprotein translocase subunit SecG [Lactobacillus sp.]